jgi:hypothetical protein
MSYSRYKMDFGMKVPKVTRHYNRKKGSQKYQIQNSVNVYNYSQNRSSAFEEESINFDMVSENINFNISEEHVEQQQELELERQFLEIIEIFLEIFGRVRKIHIRYIVTGNFFIK